MPHRMDPPSRAVPSCVPRQLPGCQVVAHILSAGRIASHRVDRALVAAVISGGCETRIAGYHFEGGDDHAWCEPAGDIRTHTVLEPGTRVLSVLPDERTETADLFHAVRPALERPARRSSAEMALAARRAWVEFGNRDSAAPLALMGHVLVLLSSFARDERQRHHARQPPWLPRVRDYLRECYREPLGLTTVAAVAEVDPAHLCRAFRAHTGTTVAEYVRRLRVAWAARRLSDTDLPLTTIALGGGFTDQSHFTKLFRQHLGVTPAAYRARFRDHGAA